MPDAVVVGAGPNGLSAAITLARSGLSVEVLEATDSPGGSARSHESHDGLILDDYSAVYPLALASPFFRSLDIENRIRWVRPTASFAHASESKAVIAYCDLNRTLDELDQPSRRWWAGTFGPLDRVASGVTKLVLGPMMHPRVLSRDLPAFTNAVRRATIFSAGNTDAPNAAKSLIAGSLSHSGAAIGSVAAAAAGVFLTMHAHQRGWAIPVGGARSVTDFLVDELLRLGGKIQYGHTVRDLRSLDSRTVVIAASSATQVSEYAPEAVGGFGTPRPKPGVSVSRVDLVMRGPIPWTDVRMQDAGTVHLGGSWRELKRANRAIRGGHHAERSFVLLSQPSMLDPTRSKGGQQIVWAYVQVPFGSPRPQSGQVLRELERHAPGVSDLVTDVVDTPASRLGDRNPSLEGGDISGGSADLLRLLARPRLSRTPWRTNDRRLYLGSSSAAPGPGVHGMCGWWAARTALKDHFGISLAPEPPPAPEVASFHEETSQP